MTSFEIMIVFLSVSKTLVFLEKVNIIVLTTYFLIKNVFKPPLKKSRVKSFYSALY